MIGRRWVTWRLLSSMIRNLSAAITGSPPLRTLQRLREPPSQAIVNQGDVLRVVVALMMDGEWSHLMDQESAMIGALETGAAVMPNVQLLVVEARPGRRPREQGEVGHQPVLGGFPEGLAGSNNKEQ